MKKQSKPSKAEQQLKKADKRAKDIEATLDQQQIRVRNVNVGKKTA